MITSQERQELALPSGSQQNGQRASEPLLTFKEAMRFLRVSRSTLYRLMWSGQLPGHKVGHTWRFYRSELQASIRNASPNAPTTREEQKSAKTSSVLQ